MNPIKTAIILMALIILSTIATLGQYIKVDTKEHICNSKNTECDLEQEEASPLFSQVAIRRQSEYNVSIRSIA